MAKSVKALLKGARRWDKGDLAEIYDRYSPGIYRYAMRLLGNADVAEECVAESFERFLVVIQRGGGPNDHLQAYLYRVAHNWVSDYYRRQAPASESPDTDLPSDANVEGSVLVNIEQEKLRKALALLTNEQRLDIALKYLDDFPNKEISAVMGKPVGAVKALQHRGLAALQRILQREDPQQND